MLTLSFNLFVFLSEPLDAHTNDDKATQTCILSLPLCCFTHSHWPRSEHWTTLRWHWQPKGHMGMSGGGTPTSAEPSSSSLIIASIPPVSILSMAKSQKPFCSKGRAEEGENSRTTHSNSRREQCDSIFILTWYLRKHKKKRAQCQFYCTWAYKLVLFVTTN